jgi:hypothetical protein
MKPHEIRAKSFEEKLVWFRHQVEKKRISWKNGADFLKIRREFILGDSMESLATVNLFKEVKIVFDGEQVQDAGGLIREWAGLIAKEMFSRETGRLKMEAWEGGVMNGIRVFCGGGHEEPEIQD